MYNPNKVENAFHIGILSHNKYIKLKMKGDHTYTCNLQPCVTTFSGLCLILRFAQCGYIVAWHILHVLHMNKYIILWRVTYQIWQHQVSVWTSSVVIKKLALYWISLGLTPAYDIRSFRKQKFHRCKLQLSGSVVPNALFHVHRLTIPSRTNIF